MKVKMWNGKRITTFREVDTVFKLPKGTAKTTFMSYRGNFFEGDDFMYASIKEYNDVCDPQDAIRGNPTSSMILLLESGLRKLTSYLEESKRVDPIAKVEPDDVANNEMTSIATLGVFERDNKILVSSRDVARVFEKEHRDVLKSIRNLEVSSEFSRCNFAPSDYKDERGKIQPEYIMTRDGFTILAMGYTGKKAMRFKEAYIQAFNEMERKLLESDSKELTVGQCIQLADIISRTPSNRMKYQEIILRRLYPVEFDAAIVTNHETMDNELGKRIADALQENGLMQKDLAEMLDCTKSTISHYINGKSKPRGKQLQRIVEILNIVY